MRISIIGMIFLLFFCQVTFANLPYAPLVFPRDEAAHFSDVPYTFNRLIEWWYLNGTVTTDDNRHFGYDIALFNPAVMFNKPLLSRVVVTEPMLHMQVADLDNQKTYGVVTHYLPNTGHVSTKQLDIVIHKDYLLRKIILDGKEAYQLTARGHQGHTALEFNLILQPAIDPLLVNQNGLMPMLNNTNSYYYSIPHLKTTGSIQVNQKVYPINAPGDSWLDHQWGDFDLMINGWEWFSIRLNNGLIAHVFLNVEYKTNTVVDGSASIVLPSGEKRFLGFKDFHITRDHYWYDPKLSIRYPTRFQMHFPSLGLSLDNVALFPQQELHGYWEGYCRVNAVYNQQAVQGFSYTEMVYNNPVLESYSRFWNDAKENE